MALIALATLGAGMLVALPGSSSADVGEVKGSAYGYFSSVAFGGGPPEVNGSSPTVTLASDASDSPQTATQASASIFGGGGVATLFTSGQLDVGTSGSLGPTGSASSNTRIQDITDANGEVFRASDLTSTCTATEAEGAVSSAAVAGGFVTIDSGFDDGDPTFPEPGEHLPVEVAVPASPAANTVFNGHLHLNAVATEFYSVTFNEQVVNLDGSRTVYAAHVRLGLETNDVAKGDIFLGKAECGVTVAPGTTTTTAPTTTTTTTVATDADLSVTKSGPSSIRAGRRATYTVKVLNGGPATANNVIVVDTLPADFSVSKVTGPNCSQTGQTVTCTQGSLGTSRKGLSVKIIGSFTATGNSTNTVTATADNFDPNTADNTANVTTSVT